MPASRPSILAAAVLDEESRRRAEPPAESSRYADLYSADAAPPSSLRDVVQAGGVRTVAVLAGLGLIDQFDRAAFAILGPDIQRSIGLSDLQLGLVGALGGLLLALAAVPIGHLADHARRTAIVGVCSALWVASSLMTGFVQATWQLLLVRVLVGVGKANEVPVQTAILADAYPIEGRNRVLGVHRAAQPAGDILGPLFAGAVVVLVDGDDAWRWAFVALSLPAAMLAMAASLLPEPRRGRHEQLAVLGEVQAAAGPEPRVPIAAAFARLRKIKTFSYLLAALGALGFAAVTVPIYVNLLLERQLGLDAVGRGVVGAVGALGGLVGVAIGGTAGDRLFRADPARSVRVTGGLVALYGVLLPLSLFMPNAVAYALVHAVAVGAVLGAFVPVFGLVAAITPYRLRSMGFAVMGIYLSLLGGLVGAVVVGSLAASLGERTALVLTVPPAAFIGGALIAVGSRFVRVDLRAAADELLEERGERERVAAGGAVPALQVRDLDYSYGQVQVLFGVGLDVWPGEVVALLGTNGAGKSTLLRAVCGLGTPDRGVVRVDGREVTFDRPADRVRAGIVQVPGGHAVFPTLSVAENLLAGAYTYVWDQTRVRRTTEEVLELFPVLRQRLDQPAGTLSGGEQQMLALASALLLEPRLLLIDELSLGLAPAVVQELLEVVAELKRRGITMVIVEQSVNVALAIADRAVFMEKGTVRFEGPAAELADRDDLVRAVFLGRPVAHASNGAASSAHDERS